MRYFLNSMAEPFFFFHLKGLNSKDCNFTSIITLFGIDFLYLIMHKSLLYYFIFSTIQYTLCKFTKQVFYINNFENIQNNLSTI